MPKRAKRVIFKRDDLWQWELVVDDVVVATNPAPGYADVGECRTAADLVIAGAYRDADKRIRDLDT